MPRPDRKVKEDCQLKDRNTGKPVAGAVPPMSVTGEYDVTGLVGRDRQLSDASIFLARDAAVAKAQEDLSNRYECAGGCGDDRLCHLVVTVLGNRSARLVRRMVPNDPDSFPYKRLGQKASEHVYVQIELTVTCECRCIARPPVTSGGSGVQETGFSGTVGGVVSFD
jgi:hypothetical protein